MIPMIFHRLFSANLDLTSLQARRKLIGTATNSTIVGFFKYNQYIVLSPAAFKAIHSHQTLKYSPKSAFIHVFTS